jgi:hypothetical protein
LAALIAPSALCAVRFEVSVNHGLITEPQTGRLFVVLSQTNNPDPRLTLGKTGRMLRRL